MIKKEIRNIYKEKRAALSDSQMDKFNDLILVHFQQIPLSNLQCVHSYIASEKLREPDTSLILRFLEFRFPGIRIAAPRVDVQTLRMHHYHLKNYDGLETNIYGIEEPAAGDMIHPQDIDLVLIPMLGFDERGYRVGYGKGYYDRFLTECRPDAVFVGLSFFDPVIEIRDTDEHDIPLHFCCTPHKLYSW